MSAAGVKLPDRWMIEPYAFHEPENDVFVIYSPCPRLYAVTVDYRRRCFRGGISNFGPSREKKWFGGRGWRQALTDAAVKWLASEIGVTVVYS